MASKKKAPARVQRSTPDRLAATLQKKFGKYSALTLGAEEEAAAQIKGYCSTGIDVLDQYVIGCGGLPEGRISEVFGDEATGKTSLAYATAAAVQRAGGIVGWLDPEYSIDKDRATALGVDVPNLLVMQPDHLEQLFEMVKVTLDNHDGRVPLLLVWDSIASTNTKEGLSMEAGDSRVGDVPRLMSQELKKLLERTHKKRAHLMMLNQVRSKIGVMFGSNLTTPGGNAPKFYASVRLWLMGGKAIKNAAGEHTGKVITIMAVKNRLQPPWRKAKVRFDYAAGWNNEWSTIQHAIRLKKIGSRTAKGKKPSGRKAYEQACGALGWPAAPERVASSAGGREAESDDIEIDDSE